MSDWEHAYVMVCVEVRRQLSFHSRFQGLNSGLQAYVASSNSLFWSSFSTSVNEKARLDLVLHGVY